MKLVIFKRSMSFLAQAFNSTYKLQRVATQITHSSIGCCVLALFSQERNEHQTPFLHSHPLLL